MKGNEQIELKAQRYLYERAHLSGSCVVTTFDPFDLKQAFIDGAEWQYEQFEKERLKHCDELTAEQAQMESDFVVQHLKNFNRTPTFIDAIEYGRKQIMENAVRATIDFPLIGYDFPNIFPNYKELKDYCIRHCIKDNDKVKIIIVKEE